MKHIVKQGLTKQPLYDKMVLLPGLSAKMLDMLLARNVSPNIHFESSPYFRLLLSNACYEKINVFLKYGVQWDNHLKTYAFCKNAIIRYLEIKEQIKKDAEYDDNDDDVFYGSDEYEITFILQFLTLMFTKITDPNITNGKLLIYVIQHGDETLVDLFLKHGAHFKIVNQELLEMALQKGFTKVAQLMVDAGCKVNELPVDFLGWIIQSGNPNVIQMLIKNGVDFRRLISKKPANVIHELLMENGYSAADVLAIVKR